MRKGRFASVATATITPWEREIEEGGEKGPAVLQIHFMVDFTNATTTSVYENTLIFIILPPNTLVFISLSLFLFVVPLHLVLNLTLCINSVPFLQGKEIMAFEIITIVH